MAEKKSIPFVKMHGIGNDYIYIDFLNKGTSDLLDESQISELSKAVSDRHFGVGSDGLILILPSHSADFRMRIFNADGSEAKMCGNGIRCVGKYVRDLGFTDKDIINVETESGVKQLHLIRNEEETEGVVVDMGSPFFKRGEIPAYGDPDELLENFKIRVNESEFEMTGVGMGNPHGIIYVDKVDSLDLAGIGPQIENATIWPDRANIEFVEVINRNEIKIRVWERGSGETLACGTGACASAVASFKKGLTGSVVKVHLRGGMLLINYDPVANNVTMTGPAKFIAKGEFFYKKDFDI